jgi:hypothetical protein
MGHSVTKIVPRAQLAPDTDMKESKEMDINKELTNLISKVLVSEGYDKGAAAYVLSNYDLYSYLIEDSLKVIKEQITDITKVMEI